MKSICFLLLFLMCTSRGYSQDSLAVELHYIVISADTLEVVVHLVSTSDSLAVPVSAFQFDIESSNDVQYLDAVSNATLSASKGWTTATNHSNQRVAGFSSSPDAIRTPGTLIALYFKLKEENSRPSVCLNALRLNSGNPTVTPAKPCLSW